MPWRIHLLLWMGLFVVVHSKEETKRALIITLDELKPEDSDVVISDLTIEEQKKMPKYQKKEIPHSPLVLESKKIEKELDYIFVRPEDIQILKNLEGLTVEKPKYVKYPDSSSSETYDTDGSSEKPQEKGTFFFRTGYPKSPSNKRRSTLSKYPSRPAPPLLLHSVKDSKEEEEPSSSPNEPHGYHEYDSSGVHEPHIHSSLSTYPSPGGSSGPNNYLGISSYSSPSNSKSLSYSKPSSYGSSKPSSYSGDTYTAAEKSPNYSSQPIHSPPLSYENYKPNTYSRPSLYAGSNPGSFSDTSKYHNLSPSSYSGHSYGSSEPNDYAGPSIYHNSKSSSYSGHSAYGDKNINAYSGPSTYDSSKLNSYSGPATYGSIKPISYSKPANYDSSKPSSYSRPSIHGSSKPNSYLGTSNYDEPKPSGHFGPSTYSSSKPSGYPGSSIYSNSKPSSYSEPSTYSSTKPSSYSDHENPNSYSHTSSYSGPEKPYTKQRSSNYSSPSSYPGPVNSYSYKSPYSRPSNYHGPVNPHYDYSAENYSPDSEKYNSNNENFDHPDTPYPYDNHQPPTNYDTDSHYAPEGKPLIPGYYDSPSVTIEPAKHIYYDDLPSPNSSPSHASMNEPSQSYHDHPNYDAPKDKYSVTSKPYYGRHYYNNIPTKIHTPIAPSRNVKHISYDSLNPDQKPYGTKVHGASSNFSKNKSRTTLDSKLYKDDEHTSTIPVSFNPQQNSYNSLKASYADHQDLSSQEEPETKHSSYHYRPSYKGVSEATYDPPPYNYDQEAPLLNLKGGALNANNNDFTLSKPNYERGYYSTHDIPNEEANYKSNSASSNEFDDPPHFEKEYQKSNHESHSSYPKHPTLEYGTRYSTSYRNPSHTDSKTTHPFKNNFASDDDQPSDFVETYQVTNPETGVKQTHSHYHHYHDDSTEISDNHSAKKNYSPVRPAPSHDQLEQPRHPPLPRRSKTSKAYYDSEEDDSKESKENYSPQPSYTDTKSYDPTSHETEFRKIYDPHHTSRKFKANSTKTDKNKNYDYIDQSTEDSDDEPREYTKTITTTYTKPSKSASKTNDYQSENPPMSSYKPPITSYGGHSRYSKPHDFVPSQPEYFRPPVYKDVPKYLTSYSLPKSLITEPKSKKSVQNSTMSLTPNDLLGIIVPKRVEGIVYRARIAYPHVKIVHRHNGYLPYKTHSKKETTSHDYKQYDSLPSELKESNITQVKPRYVTSKNENEKSRHASHTKYTHSSEEESDEYEDSNEDSNMDAIPGDPGKDYPVLKEIPHHRFNCEDKHPGFYADIENRCQVYYQCGEQGRMQSFLCPNGTVFNQRTFVCEWWHNVDCPSSEKYFSKNNQLYKVIPKEAQNKEVYRKKYIIPLKPETSAKSNHQKFYYKEKEEYN